MLRTLSVRCWAHSATCTRMLSTSTLVRSDNPGSGGSKPVGSILNSLGASSDGTGSTSWLQQRLQEEKANTKTRKPARSPWPHSAGTDGSSKGATSGFVKIDKSSKTAKATAEEEEVESESTLTPKTLLEKLKWEQSGERMQRLRLRAKDKDLEGWQRRKIEWRIKKVEGDKAGETWGPTKKLATSSMEKIRLLNAEFPNEWTIKKLSDQFHVSQEAVRRIIKSKFRPTEERTRKREAKRKEQIEQYRKGTFKHAKDRADDRSE